MTVYRASLDNFDNEDLITTREFKVENASIYYDGHDIFRCFHPPGRDWRESWCIHSSPVYSLIDFRLGDSEEC